MRFIEVAALAALTVPIAARDNFDFRNYWTYYLACTSKHEDRFFERWLPSSHQVRQTCRCNISSHRQEVSFSHLLMQVNVLLDLPTPCLPQLSRSPIATSTFLMLMENVSMAKLLPRT
ncbi:hypothetical protein KCU71_g149, partial [Aureobasidium melanogenum]